MSSALYKQLGAIFDTTKDHPRPLHLEVRGEPNKGGLWLAAVQSDRRDSQHGVTLASVPFNPANPDEAAEDLARRLTLDGQLPKGMRKPPWAE